MKQRDIHTRTVVVTEPTSDPIALDEAKEHLRVTQSDEDIFIESLISASTAAAEGETWRRYEVATYKLYLDDFPQVIEVEPVPVRSVESVQYIDSDGNTQTITSTNYHVDIDSEPARIWSADDFTWPIPDDRPNSVIVNFKAGYEVRFTVDTGTDTITATNHWFSDDDVVRLRVSGDNDKILPPGLSADTDYYVINTSGDTLQLSATSGGSAIDVTGAGTGRFFIYEPPSIPRSDIVGILLMVGHFYENREEVVVSNGTLNIQQIPNGARWLLGKNSMQRPV